MSEPRGFLVPLVETALLFAALGPPIGGALFIPLAVILKPPAAAGAVTASAFIAALLGHTILLVAAYVVGAAPAATTGLLFALWDASAPERWPRSLVAAIIGGAVTYAIALRIASLGAAVDFTIEGHFDARTAHGIDQSFSGAIDGAVTRAFVGSGAIAAFACAMAANLLGLTTRQTAGAENRGAV